MKTISKNIQLLLLDIILHIIVAAIFTYLLESKLVFITIVLTIIFDFVTINDGNKLIYRFNKTIILESKREKDLEIGFLQKIAVNPFCFFNTKQEDITPSVYSVKVGDDSIVRTLDGIQVVWNVNLNIYKNIFMKLEKGGEDVFEQVLSDFKNSLRSLINKMDYKDLEALADMTMSQLERKFKKSKGDLFFSKIEKYGLGIESIDFGPLSPKNDEMAKAKEKKALQIIENEARKANQDEFNIRLTIAKINALVPYSKKTLEECLINSGSSGSQNTLSDYNAALIYATDACINDGMTRSDFDSVISKAVNDQKLFENLTTENQINNTGGGASAVPVVSVGGASK